LRFAADTFPRPALIVSGTRFSWEW
jgi:hypothetical protein